MKLFYSLALFFFFCSTHAQVLNDDLKNFRLETIDFYWYQNCFSGDDSPTFLIKSAISTNNSADYLMNWSWNQNSNEDYCVNWSGDVANGSGPSPYTSYAQRIVLEQNLNGTSNLKVDVEFQSWSNNQCPFANVCTLDSGTPPFCYQPDCWQRRDINIIDCGYGYPFSWQNFNLIADNNALLRTRYIWRYKSGIDANDPLTFGTLASNTTYLHENSNLRFNGPNNDKLGYLNNWTSGYNSAFMNSPDVTYAFTIADNTKTVSISTTELSWFDTVLHLLKSTGGGNFDYIGSNNNIDAAAGNYLSEIVATLDPGDYIIVVEGDDSVYEWEGAGGFEVSIEVNDALFSAGTLSTPVITGLCDGAAIPTIYNETEAGLVSAPEFICSALTCGDLPVLEYRWEKSTNEGQTWENIPANVATLVSDPDPQNVLNTPTAWFRRIATQDEFEDTTAIIVFNSIGSGTIEAGEIEVSGSLNIPTGTDPGFISSLTDASGAPGPFSYYWEQSLNFGTWETVSENSDSTVYDIPTLTASAGPATTVMRYRRVATNDCGLSMNSNEISINVIIPNGSISGRVTSPPGNAGQSAGVDAVLITAERISVVEGGNLTDTMYTAMTDNDGYYTITDIYYGPDNADFNITPSKIQNGITHYFDPSELTGQNIATVFSSLSNKNFTDTTTFTFSGNIYQDFSGTTCGMDSVLILLNGIPSGMTDADGDYSIVIPNIGNYTITPQFQNHVFLPAEISNIYIDNNFENQNFENLSTQTLSGFAGIGCNTGIGLANIEIWSEDGCYMENVEANPYYSTLLPAGKYILQSIDFADPTPYNVLAVNNFFNTTVAIDLTNEDQVHDFIYQPEPTIRVSGLPEATCNFLALEQMVPIELTIEVFGGALDSCPLDTGTVYITDEISDKNSTILALPISNGIASYTINPGVPNTISPHLKNLNIVARDTFDQSVTYNLDALVTGARPRQESFTTVTPEVPLMILRDPPGDKSYSYVQQAESMELATSFYTLQTNSVNLWSASRIGTQFEAGFLGFSTESDFWGEVSSSLEVSAISNTTEEAIVSVSTTQLFSTSDNQLVTGTEGDVFIGAAMNLRYAVADIIELDGCEVISDVDLIIRNEGFATNYIYTEQYIRDVTMTQLQFLADNISNPDSAAFYLNQINVWEQALERNEDLKENAIFEENISFSNNAPYDSYTTKTTTDRLFVELGVEVASVVAAEVGLEVAGNGTSGGVIGTMRLEFGVSAELTAMSEFTTGYHLEDDDLGDGFTVDIHTDPVYKTPVFKTISGTSSCPHEANTQPRDDFSLVALNPVQTNVDPTTEAEFVLRLDNISQSEETRTYALAFDQTNNPDGAEIKVGGTAYSGPINYTIPPNSSINVTVKVGTGITGVYSYEGLAFSLSSACEPSLKKTITLSAFFDSPCSDIALFAPTDGWIINGNSNLMNVHIKDYDKSQLTQIQVQTTPVGVSAWTVASSISPADLNDNIPGGSNLGTIVPVNLAFLEDGKYDLRLKLVCGSSTIYSERISGSIDRTAPLVYGIPSPTDDHYDPASGDLIAISFNEWIDCNATNASIIALNTNLEYPASIACYENTLTLTPSTSLEDGLYQVRLSNIYDLAGNNNVGTNWIFTTGNYAPGLDCNPIIVNNNNENFEDIDSGIYIGTTIQSSDQVEENGNVEMKAEISVLLDAGFEVPTGAAFSADIAPCPDE